MTRASQYREETDITNCFVMPTQRLLHHGIRQAAVSLQRIPPIPGGEGNTAEYRIDGKWKRSNLQSQADGVETDVLTQHYKAITAFLPYRPMKTQYT